MKTLAHISITHPLLMQNEEYKAMAERSKLLKKIMNLLPLYNSRTLPILLDYLHLSTLEDVADFEPLGEGWYGGIVINGVRCGIRPKKFLLQLAREWRQEFRELEPKRKALKKKLVEELGGIKAFDAYDKQRKKD